MSITITSEQLAYWYLRLNGFLTIQNFVVHPEIGGEQRTDVDILGVRFPYRAELLNNPMRDDRPFISIKQPYIVIAEVKRRLCDLNGPWVRREQQNMHRVLRAIGAFPQSKIDEVAESIYTTGIFTDDSYHLSLCCFGESRNPVIQERYPAVPQKTWGEVLRFIYDRFRRYLRQKASHGQWDENGQRLWDCAERSMSVEEFIQRVAIS